MKGCDRPRRFWPSASAAPNFHPATGSPTSSATRSWIASAMDSEAMFHFGASAEIFFPSRR